MEPDIKIIIQNSQRKYPLDKKQISDWIGKILWLQGKAEAEVGLTFVNDSVIRAFNRQYRGKDAPTDVLSFSMLEGIGGKLHPHFLGDVMISLERAYKEAPLFYRNYTEQLLFLLIHGLLHLLGYDHEQSRNEARRMQRREKQLFDQVYKIRPLSGTTRRRRRSPTH